MINVLKKIMYFPISRYYSFRYLRKCKLAEGVNIYPPFYIENSELLKFDKYCHIGPGAFIAAKGGVIIENNVILAPQVSIWSYSHDYRSDVSVPYGGPDKLAEVRIGANVWIGYGAIILPGTNLGEGCVVGAGAVVKGRYDPGCIIVGNPGVVIGKRDEDLYLDLVSANKLYLPIKAGKTGV